MKHCKDCEVWLHSEQKHCLLCGSVLTDEQTPQKKCGFKNEYPDLSRLMATYNLFYRIALFVTLLGVCLCVLINLLLMPDFLWSIIVAASAVYFWVVVPPLLRKGTDFAKQTLLVVVLTSMLVCAIDLLLGWRGWSVSFVVPALFMAGTAILIIMIIFNRTNWSQYVLYQVLVAFFGLVPLVLFLLDIAQSLIMVLICAAISLASILGAAVFGDKTIKSEFKRRFHF